MTRAETMVRAALNVRPDTLRCGKCGRWLPDEEFSWSRNRTRRNRKWSCKDCERARLQRSAKSSDRYLSSLACRPKGS